MSGEPHGTFCEPPIIEISVARFLTLIADKMLENLDYILSVLPAHHVSAEDLAKRVNHESGVHHGSEPAKQMLALS
jgi:hypothetical protein